MRAIISWISIVIVFLVITVLPALAVDTKGLILFFDFDHVKGNTVENMTGEKHDGTLKGGATIVKDPKKEGTGALKIAGGTQMMEVDTFKELEEYQDNTYLFWIYFTDPASGGWDQVLAKPAPGSDRSPGLWVETGGLGIHWRFNPGNMGFWGLGPEGDRTHFDQKKWYHVAGAKKGGELIGYVDGEEKGKIAVPAVHTQGPFSLYIGDSPAYGGPAAKFIIDEIVVYTRALEEDEVKEIMKGALRPVSAKGKLASTWGGLKRLY